MNDELERLFIHYSSFRVHRLSRVNMVNGIIGRKLGMTQLFSEDGSVTPVTVIKAGPCIVVQKKTVNTDGYDAVQLGLVEEKAPRRVNKPTEGHFKRAGVPPTRV